jgi:hypothetical protein
VEKYIIEDKEHVYEQDYEKHHIEKTFTENGIYDAEDESGDVTAYSKVTVNVSGGGEPPVLISKTINQNGSYNALSDEANGYSDVTVNVPIPPTLNILASASECPFAPSGTATSTLDLDSFSVTSSAGEVTT